MMARIVKSLKDGLQKYPEAMHVLDGSGRIILWNDEMERLAAKIGFAGKFRLGATLQECYPAMASKLRHPFVEKAFKTLQTEVIDGLTFHTTSGEPLEIEIRFIPLGLEGNRYLLTIFLDRTSLRKAVRELARVEEAFGAVVDGAIMLSGFMELDALLVRFSEMITKVVPTTDLSMVLLLDANNRLKVAAAGGRGSEEQKGKIIGKTPGLIGRALSEPKMILARLEPDSPDPMEGMAELLGIPPASVLITALRHGDKTLGAILLVSFDNWAAFDAGEQRIVESYTSLASMAVVHARLWVEATERAARLEMVSRLVRGISSMLDLEALVANIAKPLAQILPVHFVAIIAQESPEGYQSVEIELGLGSEIPKRRDFPEGGRLLSRIGAEGYPVAFRIDPESTDPEFRFLLEHGLRSIALLPLVEEHRIAGSLVLGSREEGTFPIDQLSNLALHLGSPLAVAMSHRRLYRELRRKVVQLGALHDLDQKLLGSLSAEGIIRSALLGLSPLFADGVVGAFLTDPGSGNVQEVGTGLTSICRNLQPAMFQSDRKVMEWPALPQESHPVARTLAGKGFVEAVGFPLMARDYLAGMLWLGWKEPGHLRHIDLEWLEDVVAPLCLALENAKLYADLERSFDSLKSAQEALVQKERLAVVGRLSAMVAHEVRNPLTVMFNSTSSIRKILKPTGDAEMLLNIIEEEAGRLSRMVDDLLEFSKPKSLTLLREQLPQIVDEALEDVLGRAGQCDDLEVIRSYPDPNRPVAMVDRHRISQALVNLMMNAIQAMEGKGVFKVTVSESTDGSSVISISDTGPGIPEKLRSRIFEPFFTTKPSGVGLGLSIVRRVVEDHQGELAIESEEGKGTTFFIRLPALGEGK